MYTVHFINFIMTVFSLFFTREVRMCLTSSDILEIPCVTKYRLGCRFFAAPLSERWGLNPPPPYLLKPGLASVTYLVDQKNVAGVMFTDL